MSAAPRALRRAVASILALALAVPMVPAGVLGQEEAPIPVSDAFEVSGAAVDTDAVVSWTVTVPDEQWRVETTAPAGESAEVTLRDADGNDLGRAADTERAALFDLALTPGDYELRVPRSGREDHTFELMAFPERVAFDPEPNDQPASAVPIADGEVRTGRLASHTNDDDRYVLEVPPGDTVLRDIELVPSGDASARLCLEDEQGAALQCRSGEGRPLALTDLALGAGSHRLHVSGTEDETAPYELSVVPTGTRSADHEAEPNDEPATATALGSQSTARGRVSRVDDDYLDIVVEDDAQLWNVEASGVLDKLAWVRGNREVAATTPSCDGSPAVLEDLYLGPGTHRFMVAGCAGDELAKDEYTLTFIAMGLPDPEAEREPNNNDVLAEPYRIGDRRIGRLPTIDDTDVFRFTLGAPAGVHLRLAQPPAADTVVRLLTSNTEFWREQAAEPGATLEVDLWLRAGDYVLVLDPRTAAEGTYELTTERIDPYAIPVDAEPNHAPGYAREAPPSLTWSGSRSGYDRDVDAYWLPPLTLPGPVTIRVGGERPSARLYRDPLENEQIELQPADDGSFVAEDAPADVPLYLEVWTDGDYTVSLAAPGWTPAVEPADMPLSADLTLETAEVAAYWTEGQALSGDLVLENTGSADLELTLDVLSDHYAFSPRLEASSVSVPAGGSTVVPLGVRIRPDVWAGWPVTVTVGARAADGGIVTASATVEGVAGAEPVGSHRSSAVPEALLGGLNVAGAALGGVPGGTIDPADEALLYDDVTPAGGGFGESVGELPMELIVDLAGGAAVPVRGTVLNPLARQSRLDYSVRDFELLLSADGTTWESALSGTLERLPIDQYYALESAMPATHAMLRVHSLHGDGRSTQVSLGEWKVIAEPGTVPDTMPADIGDPVRGGHLARSVPNYGSPADTGPVDDDLRRKSVGLDRDGPGEFEMVLGFQEARAAQVTELRWTDPDGTRPDEQATALEVEVSTDGPLGPWESLGWWELVRGEDGSVAPFVLEEPVWARYVRLAVTVDPEEVRQIELPGHIDVLERATDDEYRSILGEWGYTSRVGPFEWSTAAASEGASLGPDAGDDLEAATDIAGGVPWRDRATIVDDPDWFRFEVPEGDNTISVVLEGVPAVGVGVALYDADGAPRELPLLRREQRLERYEAPVEPGTYYLAVEQPPFNVAFTFDTSGSMGPYLDFVYEGMRAFTAGIQPGRELAMIVPFDEPPLLDEWSDQPHVLEDAVTNYIPVMQSSDILSGILSSSRLLADREGTRAVLAVGDAETGTNLAADLWASLGEVGPVVYTVHVGADSDPEATRNMMQSWAASDGGVYDYPTTHAAMERAFERMSTQLRQPSVYMLTTTSAFVDRTPARLSVVSPPGQTLGLAGGTAVALILDTSGSMNKRLDGRKRIVVAKNSMKKLVKDGLAEGLSVSLRVFGGTGKKTGCETRQLVELGPLDREATTETINKLKIDKKTGTPIAAALREVENDLADVTGERIVVLITDGKATCKEDPADALAGLDEAGIEVNLNIVGFALDDDAVKEQMRGWAESNAGTYYDAADAAALVEAVTVAVAAPVDVFSVSDRSTPVASTTVGGDPVELEPGEYVLEVRSDPPLEIEGIVLAGGENKTHELAVPESFTSDEEDAP